MQIPSPPELCFQKFIYNNFLNSVVFIFFSAETDTNYSFRKYSFPSAPNELHIICEYENLTNFEIMRALLKSKFQYHFYTTNRFTQFQENAT